MPLEQRCDWAAAFSCHNPPEVIGGLRKSERSELLRAFSRSGATTAVVGSFGFDAWPLSRPYALQEIADLRCLDWFGEFVLQGGSTGIPMSV